MCQHPPPLTAVVLRHALWPASRGERMAVPPPQPTSAAIKADVFRTELIPGAALRATHTVRRQRLRVWGELIVSDWPEHRNADSRRDERSGR